MNYLDYIQHVIYSPDIFSRRYDFDLPEMKESARRVLIAALPFIGLYKPAGLVLSVGMNGARAFTHLQKVVQIEKSGTWKEWGSEVGSASLALLALAGTVYSVAVATLITTSADIVQSGALTAEALWNREYAKAMEEALQMVSSLAYLGFIVTGGLEMMCLFTLLQALTSLYQARKEFKEHHWIEGVAKLGMGMIRISQAKGYVRQIQRRNAFLEMAKMQALFAKIIRAREASHLIHHPLSSLKERIEAKEVVFEDEFQDRASFGAHFHGFGGELVKGENLAFRTRVIDGKEVIEFDFKVNHAFRDDLDDAIKQFKSIQGKQLQEILELTGSHAKGITVDTGSFFPGMESYYGDVSVAHRVHIRGVGTILIGKSQDIPNLYDRVIVHMDPNQSVYDLHEALCLMNLDKALNLSTQEDIERLKLGHLFRNFFPREATPFERSKEFFELPLGQLKEKMFQLSPEMETVYGEYYHRMKEEHLFDGRVRYRIEGLGQAAREEGAVALTSAIMGAYKDEELFDRVASLMKLGLLSTEVRKANEFSKDGLGGGGIDFITGGADSVYTQMITDKNCQNHLAFDEFYYQSKVRLLISLDALEMGSYQYHSDSFGNRLYESENNWWWGLDSYKERESIIEFIRNEQQASYFNGGHEVMLKERVAPSFFQGLVVSDERTRSALINHLQSKGVIVDGCICGKPADKFIHVADHVSEELFA